MEKYELPLVFHFTTQRTPCQYQSHPDRHLA
ncbi:hypothetical protein L246_21430 [Salmonella enterica subsp. enterica serovar Worthington str. BCH-5715]|nr:hypothetical protein L246_21430 [Salmonella enterica subsp. enterica serovar Worthington str. BCH-5715]